MGILESVQQWAKSLVRQVAPVDPAVFGDPIALKTQWTRLSPGGASFATHRLLEVDSGRLELRKSRGSFVFGGLFVVVGLGMLVASAIGTHWLLLVVGVLFTAAGASIAWPTSLVFDSSSRQIRLRKGPLSFSAIYAVQIVKELVQNNKSRYWSYELNLVLKDGERVNVVDHGDLQRIRNDGQKISALIGCKLWDATAILS